jgi:hypothetical protein
MINILNVKLVGLKENKIDEMSYLLIFKTNAVFFIFTFRSRKGTMTFRKTTFSILTLSITVW